MHPLTNQLPIALGAITLFGLSACSGNLYTYEPLAVTSNGGKESIEETRVTGGVPYLEATPVVEVKVTTVAVDKNGKVQGKATEDTCEPIIQQEYKTIATSVVQRIAYEPGFLENSKFSVTLNDDSTLKSVNSDSTTTAALDSLTGLAGATLPYFAMTEAEEAADALARAEKATELAGQMLAFDSMIESAPDGTGSKMMLKNNRDSLNDILTAIVVAPKLACNSGAVLIGHFAAPATRTQSELTGQTPCELLQQLGVVDGCN